MGPERRSRGPISDHYVPAVMALGSPIKDCGYVLARRSSPEPLRVRTPGVSDRTPAPTVSFRWPRHKPAPSRVISRRPASIGRSVRGIGPHAHLTPRRLVIFEALSPPTRRSGLRRNGLAWPITGCLQFAARSAVTSHHPNTPGSEAGACKWGCVPSAASRIRMRWWSKERNRGRVGGRRSTLRAPQVPGGTVVGDRRGVRPGDHIKGLVSPRSVARPAARTRCSHDGPSPPRTLARNRGAGADQGSDRTP